LELRGLALFSLRMDARELALQLLDLIGRPSRFRWARRLP
jgi:hypothetical protein